TFGGRLCASEPAPIAIPAIVASAESAWHAAVDSGEGKMILPITLTITGAAALLNVWLGWRCGQVRTREKILIGDGGNPLLIARMRAHANFVEYTPIVLILIGLIELAEGTSPWLWAVGVVYVLARICHAFGMDGVVR